MNFPLRIADQLKPHLRALRKHRGLTQAQLGALVGVKQARIAEIEANPGAVSLDQLTKLLAVLGGTLHLHAADDAPAASDPAAVAATRSPKAAAKSPKPPPAAAVPAKKRRPASTVEPALPRPGLVIRAKKGTW